MSSSADKWLPCPGTRCLTVHAESSGHWTVCEVRGYFGDEVWIHRDKGGHHCGKVARRWFRPLTPESELVLDTGCTPAQAGRAIELGWRKLPE